MPHYYNEKFRYFVKLVNDSYTDFYQNLSIWYEKCLKSLNITNFNDLREMILLEQYLNCVPIDVKTYLLERNVKNAREAAKISDKYTVIHKIKSKTNNFNNASKQVVSSFKKVDSINTKYDQSKNEQPRSFNQSMNRNTQIKTVDSFRQNAEVCGHCGIKGHNAYHCHKRKNVNNKLVGFVKSQLSDCSESLKQNNPFLFPITFIGSDSETTITCFRDTGCSMTLLKQNVIADEYLTPTNEFVNLQFVKDGMKNVPVFIATVSADLVDGDIKVAVVPDDAEFPEDADFLLGTDVLPLSVQNSKMVAVTTRKQAKLLAQGTNFIVVDPVVDPVIDSVVDPVVDPVVSPVPDPII